MVFYLCMRISNNILYIQQIAPSSSNINSRQSYYLQYERENVSFEGSAKLASAKTINRIEYLIRIIRNRISDLFQSKESLQNTKNIANIKREQTELYLRQLGEIGRLYGTKKIVLVNTEDMILEKLAQKDESVIFIMNHSNQQEDPQMLAVLNTLICEAYKKAGKTKFPLPEIILNEDILNLFFLCLLQLY